MATIMENVTMEQRVAQREAELHNAQIKERYRRLQNAEADQFAQSYTEEKNAADYTVRASVLAPERPAYVAPAVNETPVLEQVPQVTEYVRERIESPVFTTEKFNAVQTAVQEINVAPTPEIAVAPVTVAAEAVSTETQYSLSRAAKIAMAAFGATVVAMIALIGVNSGIIREKRAYIDQLEQSNQELLVEYNELQERIEKAKSEETIREYAESHGMIKAQS